MLHYRINKTYRDRSLDIFIMIISGCSFNDAQKKYNLAASTVDRIFRREVSRFCFLLHSEKNHPYKNKKYWWYDHLFGPSIELKYLREHKTFWLNLHDKMIALDCAHDVRHKKHDLTLLT